MADPNKFPDPSETQHASVSDVAPSVGNLAIGENHETRVIPDPAVDYSSLSGRSHRFNQSWAMTGDHSSWLGFGRDGNPKI